MLRYLAELRFLSLPQIAKLCCPSARQDLSEKSARRHMRALFDEGLVNVLPVSRAALAPPGIPNDASLLYGSAPNIYALTPRGLETLYRAGLIERAAIKRLPTYGPKNSLFLAHELAVRDVRVWLEAVAKAGGHELECWHDGEAAAINLYRDHAPFTARPDAWFVLRLQRAVLVGLVEVDRGTERGEHRWQEKIEAYATLFKGNVLRDTTGYLNARILVITPNMRRRDALAELLADQLRASDAALQERFWLAEQTILASESLVAPLWLRPDNHKGWPLVPPLLAHPPCASDPA